MKFSNFGNKVNCQSGIKSLMDDLGHAMAVNRNMLMLGGGNPAHIPEIQNIFRNSMMDVLNNGKMKHDLIAVYYFS